MLVMVASKQLEFKSWRPRDDWGP